MSVAAIAGIVLNLILPHEKKYDSKITTTEE